MNGKCIANVNQNVLLCFCYIEPYFQPFSPMISTTLCTMSYNHIKNVSDWYDFLHEKANLGSMVKKTS